LSERDPIAIPVVSHVDFELSLPGSKSITNRCLLVAALADGESVLENALFSEDSLIFAACLRALGVPVEADEARSAFRVAGRGGILSDGDASLWVGNAGTAARFITSLTIVGRGAYAVDGVAAMRERPMDELLDVLAAQGAEVTWQGKPGHVPFTIRGAGGLEGGEMTLAAGRTSQQVSGLLLIAPYARRDVTLRVPGKMVSPSYVDMTIELMRRWGVRVQRPDAETFVVEHGQRYVPSRHAVEPDASGASYFFAAAAAVGGRARVRHLSAASLQGDLRFVDVLERMGCKVSREADAVEVRCDGSLAGVDVDMNDISDTAPTLAAIAPLATGPVTIRNVEHMRWKETDRIHAVVTELARLGARVEELRDGLVVHPSKLHPGVVSTYKDHRMAMAFSILGLRSPGIQISDPGCVAKTFPTFFDLLRTIGG
jgi:3-phosphoshikimate 1-carboxyvinyltransferase